MSRTKSKVKVMSFKNDIAERVEREAEKENRSVSNFVETVLLKHFERNDYDPKSEYGKFMDNIESYLKIGGAANDHDDGPDALAGLSIFVRGFLSYIYDDIGEND